RSDTASCHALLLPDVLELVLGHGALALGHNWHSSRDSATGQSSGPPRRADLFHHALVRQSKVACGPEQRGPEDVPANIDQTGQNTADKEGSSHCLAFLHSPSRGSCSMYPLLGPPAMKTRGGAEESLRRGPNKRND